MYLRHNYKSKTILLHFGEIFMPKLPHMSPEYNLQSGKLYLQLFYKIEM